MKKSFRKALSLILAVVMCMSCMAVCITPSNASTYPQSLYNNGTELLSYTSSDAYSGRYLVEIDVVKYTDTASSAPGKIESEAGDISIVYKPNNGISAELTKVLTGVVKADEFNQEGEKTTAYYAVLEGFPVKATLSALKKNAAANDAGLYITMKIWDIGLGYFTNVFDYTKIEKSNGANTSNLIFSNISSSLQFYPYAFDGTASGSDFTLPISATSSTSSKITFSVVDQWGVTMVKPKITYTDVVGLTYSQDKNSVTVKGTGDANSISASSRTINVGASYETLNPNAPSSFSTSKSITVKNNANPTYAPTYANREKGGLSLSFKAGSFAVEKFALNSSYYMTTTNYLVIKNNSSRTATISDISTGSADRFTYQTTTTTVSPGGTVNIQMIDKKSGSGSYDAKTTVTYTLAGLYNASTGSLATLSTGENISFIYNKVTDPSIHVYDNPSARKIDVNVGLEANVGILNQRSKTDGIESCKWDVDYYVNRDSASTYNGAGLGFVFTTNYGNHYKFQNQKDHSGTYTLQGNYSGAGSFGFTSSSATTATSAVKEVVATELGSSSGTVTKVPFYGNIFTPSSSNSDPAQIKFDVLQIHCPTVVANSGYFSCNLNVYAYSKNSLRSQINTCKSSSMMSCYYSADKWSAYQAMTASSAMQTAQKQLGLDMTNQKAITDATSALSSAFSSLKSSADSGTYCVNHYKHDGDINSKVSASSTDFFVFEKGASNTLKLNNDYSEATNKHTASYRATMTSSATKMYNYDYWNIDFSVLDNLINNYNEVSQGDMFTNLNDIKASYDSAMAIDRSSSSSTPTTQNEVDAVCNDFSVAMRLLEYKSFDMTVTHKMLNPTGASEINNDVIQTVTKVYNKTAKYGEVQDGTADINDGTYTIKGVHYSPVVDEKIMSYSSSYYVGGVSSSYIVTSPKDITITYYAKAIEDTRLSDMLNETLTNIKSWLSLYTKDTMASFENWFNEKYDDGTLTYGFSIFDESEYNAVVDEYQEQLDALDPIITKEQVNLVNQFVSNYEMMEFLPDAYCNGQQMLQNYKSAYGNAKDLLSLIGDDNAGSKAASNFLESVSGFAANTHTLGAHQLLNAPTDGTDGKYYVACTNCAQIVENGSIAHPSFNELQTPSYSYANRGAALRYEGEEIASTTQGMRFPASCLVPKDAEVKDFGFVYTQTRYLNSATEPTDNEPVNVNSLVADGMYITKKSMIDGKYTVREDKSGTIYSFNLVINVSSSNWEKHYAARSYVTYVIDGVEVTVYDKTYSSRSANYLASCIVNNPSEIKEAKDFIAEKFGL